MGEAGEGEAATGEVLGKGSDRYYIATPQDREAAEVYLLSELETAGFHAKILEDTLRKIYNTANSRSLDGKWGNHLGLILGHLGDDLRYLQREIDTLRQGS